MLRSAPKLRQRAGTEDLVHCHPACDPTDAFACRPSAPAETIAVTDGPWHAGDVTGHPTAELVGACYDAAGLARWLGMSTQAVEQNPNLLACRTAAGRWVYPALQFDAERRPLPCLAELVAILTGPDDTRRWRAARWLAAPNLELPDQMSAANWLRSGGDPALVLAAARADAARWVA